MSQTLPIELKDILRILPHRYPFLLIDRVIEHVPGESVVALKNVTFNEPFFIGHFPDMPTMPGVLMLEALAQTSGVLVAFKSGLRPDTGMMMYFAGIDGARFKRPVVPGDQLMLHSQLMKQKRDLWKFSTRAMVGGELACEAEMMCALKGPSV